MSDLVSIAWPARWSPAPRATGNPSARRWIATLAVAVAVLVVGPSVAHDLSTLRPAATQHAASQRAAAAANGALPLAFEINRGQTASEVRYLAHGPGYAVFVTPERTVLSLSARPGDGGEAGGQGAVLSFSAVGGPGGAAVEATDPLTGRVNYLTGNDPSGWHTNIATYQRVVQRDVYPGSTSSGTARRTGWSTT